jgi:hypothetical protein
MARNSDKILDWLLRNAADIELAEEVHRKMMLSFQEKGRGRHEAVRQKDQTRIICWTEKTDEGATVFNAEINAASDKILNPCDRGDL